MSYVNMSSQREINVTREVEMSALPRPPTSNFQQALDSGLRPIRISNFQEAMDHSILLSQRLERDNHTTNIIIFALFAALCVLIVVFLILLNVGVICICYGN